MCTARAATSAATTTITAMLTARDANGRRPTTSAATATTMTTAKVTTISETASPKGCSALATAPRGRPVVSDITGSIGGADA